MRKHSIKPKQYLSRFSDSEPPGHFSADAECALDFLNRVSVFETLRSYRGGVFHFGGHWRRLFESAQGLGHGLPFSERESRHWILGLIARAGWPDAMIRLAVHWNESSSGVVVVLVRPFTAYPESLYQKGVTLRTAVPRRWSIKAQDSRLKTSQYLNGVLAILDDPDSGVREHIFLSAEGAVAEGSVSNIFIVRGKRLLTPCAASGILKGVTRQRVIQLAKKRGLSVAETFLTRHEIYTAQECFITNTSSEVLPVVVVDGRRIGEGRPGRVTKMLRGDFRRSVQS